MCDCTMNGYRKLQDIEERLEKIESLLKELDKSRRSSNTTARNHVYRITNLEEAAGKIREALDGFGECI